MTSNNWLDVQSVSIGSSAWLDSVARTVCHAVEQRSDDCDMEMHKRVKDALIRCGVSDLQTEYNGELKATRGRITMDKTMPEMRPYL
jgi:hypothetical protein